MLVKELGMNIIARDDLPKRVASGDRYTHPQGGLDGSHICSRLSLEEHLPGNIRQDQTQHRTRPIQGSQGLFGCVRCGLLAA